MLAMGGIVGGGRPSAPPPPPPPQRPAPPPPPTESEAQEIGSEVKEGKKKATGTTRRKSRSKQRTLASLDDTSGKPSLLGG